MAKITIQGIADSVIGKHGLSRNDAEAFVTSFFDLINEGLHSDKAVKVKGLGTFKVIDVRERESVNVNTGERVVIESHGKITFTPDPVMRDLVNKPFAQFETVVLNDGVELEDLDNAQAQDIQGDKDPVDVTEGEEMMTETDKEASVENIVSENHKPSLTDREILPDNAVAGEKGNSLPTESSGDVPESKLQSSASTDEPYNREGYTETPYGAEAVIADTVCDENDGLHIAANNEGFGEEVSEPVPGKTVTDKVPLDKAEQDVYDEHAVSYSGETEQGVALDEYSRGFFSRHIWFVFTFSILLVGAVGLFLGYYYGKSISEPVVKYVTVHAPEKTVDTSRTADSSSPEAYAREKSNVTVTDTVIKKTEIKQPLVKTAKEEDKSIAGNTPALKDAKAMVNTGAYRITGTDRTVTVKKGESLKQISRFFLGDGMECYIQVYNGITEAKEGMKLKIPKLENKKKRK